MFTKLTRLERWTAPDERPNPSMEQMVSIGLRPAPTAADVKRWRMTALRAADAVGRRTPQGRHHHSGVGDSCRSRFAEEHCRPMTLSSTD